MQKIVKLPTTIIQKRHFTSLKGHSTEAYMVHTPQIKQSNLESIVDKYEYFIFDCDGVLFHYHDEIGHAFKALKYLKKKNKQIYFFTNATTRTREELLNNKIIGEHKFEQIPL